MLMILARLVRSESFWAVVKVRSPHTGPEVYGLEGPQRPNLKSEDSGLRHRFSEAKVSLWMCENGTGHEEARGPTRR